MATTEYPVTVPDPYFSPTGRYLARAEAAGHRGSRQWVIEASSIMDAYRKARAEVAPSASFSVKALDVPEVPPGVCTRCGYPRSSCGGPSNPHD